MITGYFFPFGSGLTDGWLIKREISKQDDRWFLILSGPGHRRETIAAFASPEQAASALAKCQTGNPQLDATLEQMLSTMRASTRRALADLSHWEMHETE
jgi:hypothetical protein